MSPVKAEMKVIEEKIEKGEDLTDEETELFMSGDIVQDDNDDEVEESNESTTEDIAEDKEEKTTTEDSGEEKKEDVKEEVKETPKEEKKEKTEEVKNEDNLDLNSLETELSKPLGTEDLKGFNKKEQAYFWQMRRDRQARQKAEMERDELRFAEARRVAVEEAKEKTVETDTTHDPDDFVTYGDLSNLKEPRKDAQTEPNAELAWRQQYLNMCEGTAKDKFEDYTEVIECADSIVATSPVYQKQVVESMKRGENPAVFMYHLIKSDPEFDKALGVARASLEARGIKTKTEEKVDTAKVDKAKAVEDKIKENEKKPKTSGNHSGSEAEVEKFPSLEEFSSMSDEEFFALPKKKRDAVLKKYGV